MWLDALQLNLIILTKTKKKQSTIADRTHTMAKTLSTHISIVLMQVSVPVKDGSQQSAIFTHALKGSSTCVPKSCPS
jgi:hypothetical protein